MPTSELEFAFLYMWAFYLVSSRVYIYMHYKLGNFQVKNTLCENILSLKILLRTAKVNGNLFVMTKILCFIFVV